jgi:uroporphyrinogen decarboxylase
MTEAMTSRQRVKITLAHQQADRIPFYCDELFVDTEIRWLKEGLPLVQNEREELFGFDCTELFIDSSLRFELKLIEENDETLTVADKYGFVATRNKLIPGIHYHEHPVKSVDDWCKFRERLHVDFAGKSRIHEVTYFKPFEVWPTWAEAREIYLRKRQTGRYIVLRVYGPWEILWRLRGYNEAMMDLYENQELVEDIVEHLTGFLIDVVRKGISYGIQPDGLFLLDDLGSNKSLLFSPEIIRKLFFPCYKKIGEFLKEQKMDFFFHSCGDVKGILPMFVELGVDALNPLQATVMNVVDLKKPYGDKIAFLGNINSRILHDRKAVRDELDDKIPAAMRNGGYIFASDHSIPSELSLKEYLSILDYARQLGTYSQTATQTLTGGRPLKTEKRKP